MKGLEELGRGVNDAVLCWLATTDALGQPNVSPKELFELNDGHIIIANIASPKSVKNIDDNAKVCVSFIDIFKQKGFKVVGEASIVQKGSDEFVLLGNNLIAKAGDTFTIISLIKISIQSAEKILAPSYQFYPETTEAQQIQNSLDTYHVNNLIDKSQASIENFIEDYISSAVKQFKYYKWLGEKTLAQLSDGQLFSRDSEHNNSIAIIINHLSGNMVSRWTDFLTTDGEKTWRKRDEEFEEVLQTRQDVFNAWNRGWEALFTALNAINYSNYNTIIYIRNMGHSIVEAINRQLCHYSYHVGQIVLIGKELKGEHWESLSIPKGESTVYNNEKFSKSKRKSHFTVESLNTSKE